MNSTTRLIFNAAFIGGLMGLFIISFGILSLKEHSRKIKIFGIITIVVGILLFTSCVYIRLYRFPVKHKAKVTEVIVDYEDILSESSTKVSSITLIFEGDEYKIPNALKDADSVVIKETDNIDNFKNYGIVLDEQLNYPLIKKEDKQDFKKYLENKFLKRTYKEIQ